MAKRKTDRRVAKCRLQTSPRMGERPANEIPSVSATRQQKTVESKHRRFRQMGARKMATSRNGVEMYEQKESPCITTYTRTNKKQSNYNTDDYTAELIVGGIGAVLCYGLWIISAFMGWWPWI